MDFGYGDLVAPGAGTLINDGVEGFVNASRNFLCTIHKEAPGALTMIGGSEGSAAGAIAGYVGEQVLNHICAPTPPGLPPAPQPPFSGAQCKAPYRVIVTVNKIVSIDGSVTQSNLGFYVNGAIGAIFPYDSGTNSYYPSAIGYNRIAIYCYGACDMNNCGSAPVRTAGQIMFLSNSDELHTIKSIASVQITRDDGQPDNCGDPIPFYPPIAAPPNLVFNVPINIPSPFPGGSPIQVKGNLIKVDVNVNNTLEPTFAVNVGGVNVTFQNNGVNVSLPAPSSDPAPLPAPNYPPSGGQPAPTTGAPTPVNQPSNDANQVKDALKKLKDCACPSSSGTLKSVQISSGNSGVANLPPNTQYVKLDITQKPSNARYQPGGNAPNVYYAGWYSFGSNGVQGERIPVSYEHSTVYPHSSSDTFSYTLYVGFTGIATAYYLG